MGCHLIPAIKGERVVDAELKLRTLAVPRNVLEVVKRQIRETGVQSSRGAKVDRPVARLHAGEVWRLRCLVSLTEGNLCSQREVERAFGRQLDVENISEELRVLALVGDQREEAVVVADALVRAVRDAGADAQPPLRTVLLICAAVRVVMVFCPRGGRLQNSEECRQDERQARVIQDRHGDFHLVSGST